MNMQTIVLCDFDGTITNRDILDCILEKHLGKEATIKMSDDITNGITTIPQHMNIVCQYLGTNPIGVLNQVIDEYNITIDLTLYTLYEMCCDKQFTFKIISGNFMPFIYHLTHMYTNVIVSHNIVKCNDHYEFVENKIINPKYKYITQNYPKDKFNVIYIGDGISDFSVIHECKTLFAKKGSVLEQKCLDDKVTYIPFETLDDVTKILERLYV